VTRSNALNAFAVQALEQIREILDFSVVTDSHSLGLTLLALLRKTQVHAKLKFVAFVGFVLAMSTAWSIQIGPPIRVPLPGGAVGDLLHNAADERDRLQEHVGSELTNLSSNTLEAIEVSAKTINRNWLTVVDSSKAALDEVAHGDLLQAGYIWQRDLVNGARSNTIDMMQESSGLRFLAQVTVSAYFGPVGTGLFSGAYSYETTGSFDDALRVGAVSGIASAASAEISKLPVETTGEIAGRAILAGHVSGTAHAVLGGRYEDGFESGALFSLANAVYQRETYHTPNGQIGGEAYCKTILDENCSVPKSAVVGTNKNDTPKIDVRLTDSLRDHIGFAEPGSIFSEGSTWMKLVNSIPGLNTMAFFHDVWAEDFSDPLLEISIVPATVLSYYALGAPRDRDLLNLATTSQAAQSRH
jgi:hypothetical protein